MEKELRSGMGVLLRADLTGHGHSSPSAQKGGITVPYYVSPQKDVHAEFQLTYAVIFVDFCTVCG